MPDPSNNDIALHYCVEDLPEARGPGTVLHKILECLQRGQPVSPRSLAYLEKEGHVALHRLAVGELSYESFRQAALAERAGRAERTVAARLATEEETRACMADLQEKARRGFERVEAARVARESDPRYIAKIKQRELRAKYGIHEYVEPDCFSRLMRILKRVDAGQRLTEPEFTWLASAAEEYFTEELRAAYHRLEAEFFADEFRKTGDPWAAVNASSHYRKGNSAGDAESLLASVTIGEHGSRKLKSALCTTHGGVMRDLGRWDDALRLGEQAHAFRPIDYRPCTLLGALHMEAGNYGLGQEWYDKAVERGATVDDVDRDLRSIFFRANEAKRAEMSDFLIRQDSVRFAWARPRRPISS